MSGWVGVDLDRTLAHYDGFKGPGHIGEPIPRMVERVKELLKQGQDVRIFTARVSVPQSVHGGVVDFEQARLRIAESKEARTAIELWCRGVFGVVLPITCIKDYEMWYCIDDRAKQVVPDTGVLVEDQLADAHSLIGDLYGQIVALEGKLEHAQARMVLK